jgi:hypothetical protein
MVITNNKTMETRQLELIIEKKARQHMTPSMARVQPTMKTDRINADATTPASKMTIITELETAMKNRLVIYASIRWRGTAKVCH